MKINELDNVEVLLQPEGDIPAGHKVAARFIAKGENIIKYGSPIGHATCDIQPGEWVHSHNVCTNLEKQGATVNKGASSAACHGSTLKTADQQSVILQDQQILAYERADGRIGIRNELWILPTVGCVADIAQRLAQQMQQRTSLTVRAFPHNYGCSQLGEDHANTRQMLASIAMHPNAGGVLVLGLGCENNQIADLKLLIHSDRVRYMVSQEVEDEMAEGLSILDELSALAEQDTRTPQPVSRLCIGLKCGGSDGFSGITANPLLGRLTDVLTDSGATAILTEVPEMFGAEHLLMARCKDEETLQKADAMIRNFKQYYISHGQPVGENPSPGNHEGGITTLEEKSLGCVQKGGAATITDILEYGERSSLPGLCLLSAPGNDLVASTALAAAGCQMVLFTTGRGTPFGTCVPTIKVSTNSNLAARKPHWIDIDAGVMLQGNDPLPALLRLVLDVASGKEAKNEKNQYSGISIWKNGVTL